MSNVGVENIVLKTEDGRVVPLRDLVVEPGETVLRAAIRRLSTHPRGTMLIVGEEPINPGGGKSGAR